MEQYRYSPLSETDNIRLLQLLPGRNANVLRCKLLEYPLRNLGSSYHLYEALSYVWGSEDKPQSIIIDDQSELKITQNLYTGLCRLQNHSFARIIWVDAVCINQSDNTEKQHQIPLMAEIYANASHVLVWLGEAEDDGDQALKAISDAGQTSAKHVSCAELDRNRILTLLQRPWFQRIWVLQEVAAAQHVSIMCGSVEIDGHAFCLGLDFLDTTLEGSMVQVAFLIRGAIFRSRETIRDKKGLSLNICSLSELVDMYHAYKATKRHDKIFALLGMCSDDLKTAGLDPNYDLGWKELMRRLVTFILGSQVSIDTWEDREMAFIKSEGYNLGKVYSVENDTESGRQKLRVIFNNPEKQPELEEAASANWNLPKSAIPIRKDDLICLLQGTSKPMIIRLYNGYFRIVMIAAVPLEVTETYVQKIYNSTENSPSTTFTRDFSLVWDWEPTSELKLDPGNYENLIQTSEWGSSETGLKSQMRNAMRLWSFTRILEDIGEEQRASKMRQKAAEAYERALGEEQPQIQMVRSGMSILSYAASKGHGEFVKLLLATGKYDVDAMDISYWTPLFYAANNGHEEVIKLLLATGKVNVNRVDYICLITRNSYQDDGRCKGRTPLWYAARNGHENVVELLLATQQVDFEIMELFDGPTPLAMAAENGHEKMVKLLLATGKVSVVVKNKQHYQLGFTIKDVDTGENCDNQPLLLAVKNGHKGIFKLLLATGKINLNFKGWEDQTLLSMAASNGHTEIVKLLLTIPKVKIDLMNSQGRTPLSWASGNGHEEIVKLLLATGKVDVNAQDGEGGRRDLLIRSDWVCNWTPLRWAVHNQHEGIVRLLLATKRVYVNTKDSTGQTPLAWAVIRRHEGIVKLLLATGIANINAKDHCGQTPLDWAISSRMMDTEHEGITQLLESSRSKQLKSSRSKRLARQQQSLTTD